MSQKTIPSAEDFARAKLIMRKNYQGLSEVSESILKLFRKRGLHEIFVLYSPKTDSFGAYVFYDLESQIEEARDSGLEKEIRNSVFSELERVGRGSRDAICLDFVFDSHENVELNYEGDYFLRLR